VPEKVKRKKLKNKIILATALLATIIAILPILATQQVQQVQAKKHHNNDVTVTQTTTTHSIIGNVGDGYNAGKSAAISGQPDTCTGTGTAFCAAFHTGYAVANIASDTLK
jgi:hypothetical protein